MGTIRARPLKEGGTRFLAEIRLKGHPPLAATFDRKTDAKNWIQKTEADIRAGRHQLYSEAKRHTFREAVDRYMREQKVLIVKRGHLIWWDKELGHLYLHDVRPSIIIEKKQKLLTERTSKGIIRSGSTCNRFLASLSHLMTVAHKQWEWANENPVQKITREKEPRERTRFLSSEERKKLLDACKESKNPYLFGFVVLLLSTGCRYNEIRSLKVAHVDIFQRRITIVESKNGDMRSVPVCGLALELLRKLVSQSDSLGYVFPSKDKRNPLDLRRGLQCAIKRAGLKDFRPHDCRHSYASEMLAMGISLGEVGLLLGHRSAHITKKYCHLLESRSIEVVSKMSERIFKALLHKSF